MPQMAKEHTAQARQRWQTGEVIARREVLGLLPAGVPTPAPVPAWYGGCWLGMANHVVADTAEELVTYTGPGAQLHSVPGTWPNPESRHPWHERRQWAGHGALMVHPKDADYAIWHFWDGPDREFDCWYINLQTAYRRTATGIDTQDLELDLVLRPDGSVEVKDLELMQTRVTEGRFTPELAEYVLAQGEQLAADLRAGHRWWDTSWAHWRAAEEWRDARLPAGWLHTGAELEPRI